MALIARYEPWHVVDRLHRQIDQILSDGHRAPAAAADNKGAWIPAVDVHEEQDKFVVRADLPGIDSKDINITTEHGVLTLSGERKSEQRTEQKGYVRYERADGAFQRRFTLPDNVQTDQIRARHVNGVLEVTIPKVPVQEPKRVSVEPH